MKVAIVYDRVNKWGGAERVLLALHTLYPEADLFTSVYDPDGAPWARVFNVKTTFLQQIPFAKKNHDWFATLMPLAFETMDIARYDLVISVTSEAAKGVLTHPHTKHICICLTPTRYLWSGYGEYFANPFLRIIAKPIVSYLRAWDRMAATRPDVIVAISTEVQKRINTYYNRSSTIIFPPLMLENTIKEKERGNYFLIVSRLVSYKKIDLAIQACNRLKLPLKIVGTGKEERKLKQMAGSTIEFLGKVGDEELARLYSQAHALIFPGHEDFGLTMVEAQSFGTPVIALKAGGALDIVREGKTGEFFEKPEVDNLLYVLKSFDNSRYNRTDCIANSKRFSFETFQAELKLVIEAIPETI